MSSQSARKQRYHHGDLRQALINAACEHLKREGVDTLSLRALAREIGVSQTAPYRHFETKNALFAAIACYGFELLTEKLVKVREKYRDDVVRALVEVGLTYVSWAVENPEKYQLLFDSSLVDFNEYPEMQQRGGGCFEVVMSVVRQGVEEGEFVSAPIEQLAGNMWAGVHGISSLVQSKASEDLDTSLPVHMALEYLVTERRANVEFMVNGIRRRD